LDADTGGLGDAEVKNDAREKDGYND